jgi:hypothetical protein
MSQAEFSSHARQLRCCLTTKEIAAQYHAREQTVRKRYAATGAHCGIRPLKLPNGRLLWPENTITALADLKLGAQA